MSQSLVSEFMLVQTGSPISKLILLKLADNADRQGRCFPSYQYLARHCELTERTVKNHINRLEYYGFVERIARFDKRGRQRSNAYQLLLPEAKRKAQDDNAAQQDITFTGEGAGRSPAVGDQGSSITCHKENKNKGGISTPTRLADEVVGQFAERNPDHPFKSRIDELIAQKRAKTV